ncbi:MAG: hypothetical protein RMA76_36470 [Deltaproteobacteria bacterium]|jgi:hypothetical protein
MKTRASLCLTLFAAGAVACMGPVPTSDLAEPTFHEARFEQVRLTLATKAAPVEAPVVKTAKAAPKKKARPAPAPIEEVIDLALEEAADDELLPWLLSDASFNATIGDWSGVRTCVVSKRATTGGAFALEMSIDSDGKVKRTRVVEANAKASSVAPCVAAKAKRLDFEKYASNETTTRVAKFVF